MQIRLKANQTPDECNAFKCKNTPTGQYARVGYLCKKHVDRIYKAWQEETLEVVGAAPKFGNGGGTEIVPIEASNLPGEPWKQELETNQQELFGAIDLVKDFEIADTEDLQFVKSELDSVQNQWDHWETKRKEITAPLNKSLKAANDLFRPVLACLKDLEAAWKANVHGFYDTQNERIQTLLDDGEIDEAAKLLAPPEGLSLRRKVTFEVEDIDEVPSVFLNLDQKALAKAYKDGETEIPGIKVVTGFTVVNTR